MSARKRAMKKASYRSAAEDRAAGPKGRAGGVVIDVPTPQAQPDQSMTTGPGWMGPGSPMRPIAPPEVAGRRFDMRMGANYSVSPRAQSAVSFAELRFLADSYDLVRLAIETRKDQMARLDFNFVPRDKKQKIEKNGELAARAQKFQDFFRRPDKEHFWKTWLRSLLEDLLVLDAPSVHVRRTLGGDIYSLDQIDGATVKPVVDDWGRRPEYPFAAYQQILKGMPAVNYSVRDLIYKPRNVRVHQFYGYSPVEQIIMTVNVALRRQLWQLAYFTDGNLPDSLIGVPSTWTPDQIAQFQDWFDSILSGNSNARRGARFVPGEVAKSYVPTKEAEIFGAAEEWLARVVCFCFGISHQSLVKEVNRATADTAQDQAIADGLAPIMEWVKELIDTILLDLFQETELEFEWLDDKEMDPKVQSEIFDSATSKARMTINEARIAQGHDPDPSPEADMLGFITPGGFVPLSTENAIKLKQQMTEAFPPPPALGGPQVDENGDPIEDDKSKDKKPPFGGKDSAEAVAAEGEAEAGAAEKLATASAALKAGMPDPRRPLARRAQKSIARSLKKLLADLGDDVADQVEKALAQLRKADDDYGDFIDELLKSIDFGILDALPDLVIDDLGRVAGDSATRALAQLGVNDVNDLFERINTRAVDWARVRGAELVGKRVLPNGTIIDNPSAKWSITQTTRDGIRDMLTRSLEEGLGSDAIVESLQEDYLFSPERADMVSRTEIAFANSEGAMAGYRGARDAGVRLKKEWILGPNPCEVCEANAAQGPIDLDEDFESGDDATPAHPNCECATVPVVEEGGDDA